MDNIFSLKTYIGGWCDTFPTCAGLYFMCIFYLVKEYYNEVLYLKYLFMFAFFCIMKYMMCNYTNGGINNNKK